MEELAMQVDWEHELQLCYYWYCLYYGSVQMEYLKPGAHCARHWTEAWQQTIPDLMSS